MALGSVGWIMPGVKTTEKYYSYRYHTDKGGLFLPDKRYGIPVPHLQEVQVFSFFFFFVVLFLPNANVVFVWLWWWCCLLFLAVCTPYELSDICVLAAFPPSNSRGLVVVWQRVSFSVKLCAHPLGSDDILGQLFVDNAIAVILPEYAPHFHCVQCPFDCATMGLAAVAIPSVSCPAIAVGVWPDIRASYTISLSRFCIFVFWGGTGAPAPAVKHDRRGLPYRPSHPYDARTKLTAMRRICKVYSIVVMAGVSVAGG